MAAKFRPLVNSGERSQARVARRGLAPEPPVDLLAAAVVHMLERCAPQASQAQVRHSN